MNTTPHSGTGRSGTEGRRYQVDARDPKVVRLVPRKAALPAVEFGSGWYHDEAISRAPDADSHRCM